MRTFAALSLGTFLCLGLLAVAGQEDDVKALVKKAIKAHGGAENLADGPGQRAVSGQVRLVVAGKPNQSPAELLAGLVHEAFHRLGVGDVERQREHPLVAVRRTRQQ